MAYLITYLVSTYIIIKKNYNLLTQPTYLPIYLFNLTSNLPTQPFTCILIFKIFYYYIIMIVFNHDHIWCPKWKPSFLWSHSKALTIQPTFDVMTNNIIAKNEYKKIYFELHDNVIMVMKLNFDLVIGT
jgi:hypothetical protein